MTSITPVHSKIVYSVFLAACPKQIYFFQYLIWDGVYCSVLPSPREGYVWGIPSLTAPDVWSSFPFAEEFLWNRFSQPSRLFYSFADKFNKLISVKLEVTLLPWSWASAMYCHHDLFSFPLFQLIFNKVFTCIYERNKVWVF